MAGSYFVPSGELFPVFCNYLNEHMDPQWVEWEKVSAPFRKKAADFGRFLTDRSVWVKGRGN